MDCKISKLKRNGAEKLFVWGWGRSLVFNMRYIFNGFIAQNQFLLMQSGPHIFILVVLKLFSRLIIALYFDYNFKVFNE